MATATKTTTQIVATVYLIARGHQYAAMADAATTPGMALVYLKKARNFYADGGREDLAGLIEEMINN